MYSGYSWIFTIIMDDDGKESKVRKSDNKNVPSSEILASILKSVDEKRLKSVQFTDSWKQYNYNMTFIYCGRPWLNLQRHFDQLNSQNCRPRLSPVLFDVLVSAAQRDHLVSFQSVSPCPCLHVLIPPDLRHLLGWSECWRRAAQRHLHLRHLSCTNSGGHMHYICHFHLFYYEWEYIKHWYCS